MKILYNIKNKVYHTGIGISVAAIIFVLISVLISLGTDVFEATFALSEITAALIILPIILCDMILEIIIKHKSMQ